MYPPWPESDGFFSEVTAPERSVALFPHTGALPRHPVERAAEDENPAPHLRAGASWHRTELRLCCQPQDSMDWAIPGETSALNYSFLIAVQKLPSTVPLSLWAALLLSCVPEVNGDTAFPHSQRAAQSQHLLGIELWEVIYWKMLNYGNISLWEAVISRVKNDWYCFVFWQAKEMYHTTVVILDKIDFQH